VAGQRDWEPCLQFGSIGRDPADLLVVVVAILPAAQKSLRHGPVFCRPLGRVCLNVREVQVANRSRGIGCFISSWTVLLGKQLG
jgi:hypothetical protein